MTEIKKEKWEIMVEADDSMDLLDRIKVPGGWLYRDIHYSRNEETPPSVSICFVPDPNFK